MYVWLSCAVVCLWRKTTIRQLMRRPCSETSGNWNYGLLILLQGLELHTRKSYSTAVGLGGDSDNSSELKCLRSKPLAKFWLLSSSSSVKYWYSIMKSKWHWRAAEHAHTPDKTLLVFCSLTCALFQKRDFSRPKVFNSNSQQIHISVHISGDYIELHGFAINSIIYFKKQVQNVFMSDAYLHEVHFYKFNMLMFYKVLYVHTCWTRRLAEIEMSQFLMIFNLNSISLFTFRL